MSIDWEKTAELHNKNIDELKEYFKKYPKSHKKVYTICDKCGYKRLVIYQSYQKTKGLCRNCTMKGENHPKYKNNIGKIYNKIKILKEIGRDKQGAKIVLAQCHCGNKFKVLEKNLKNSSTKSCGCLTSRLISKVNYKNSIGNKYYIDDKKEKYIKVLEEIGYYKTNKIVLVQCYCGNKFKVLESHLKNGNTKSCGCLQIINTSNTDIELIMQKELEKRNYNFETQVNILQYRPDILLTDYNIIIECDGRYWHDNPESRERDKQRDIKIEKEGYKILRFWDDEIKKHINWCLKKIEDLILNYEYPNKYFMIDI